MKKIILGLTIIFSLVWSNSFAQGSKQEIVSGLQNFDVSRNGSTLGTTERKWWQTVLNVASVVVADAGGFYGGVQGSVAVAGAVGLATGGTGVAVVAGVAGTIAAAGSSNLAYQGLNWRGANQIHYGSLTITLPEKYRFLGPVGRDHNTVIHNNFFNSLPLESYYRPLLDESQIRVIEHEKMQETFTFVKNLGLSYAQRNFDFNYFANELMSKQLMTIDGKEILSAFFNKYKVCSSPTDMENLINYSINIVAESRLNEIEKESLIGAFIIASESPFYYAQ
ncbi:MAG: hypothetical protein IPO46_06460 [Chitinophagaceae bacterium]|nr:hypothetical protein [Chitinophagaceae bacterium]MBP6045508.1 hypothetical protein [Ferruginibacter sp.]MBK7089035.1 hypothetical protein [Chitinophagaceae bacterium]MBK8775098.1 hypothetical protein [Chitinophagaceae bacterium]MBL0254055.1 hypothetical protein [Chitinophagaceae bacterium]